MHLPAARARASAVGTQGAVRHVMSPVCSRTPLIGGLDYREEVDQRGRGAMRWSPSMRTELAPFRFHGWLGNRKTQSFGWRYDFEDSSFTPAEPIPDWLRPGPRQGRCVRRPRPDDFVHVLLARYDPGAGIGWHRDRDVFEHVVGISLGTPATLRFRQRTSAVSVAPTSTWSRARPICCRARSAANGSTASHPAIRFASPSPSARFPKAVAASPPLADGTLRLRNGCAAHA